MFNKRNNPNLILEFNLNLFKKIKSLYLILLFQAKFNLNYLGKIINNKKNN